MSSRSRARAPRPRFSRRLTVAPVAADPRRVRVRRRKGDDRGFAMAWTALVLVVLMGFAGFGVDTAKLWFTGQRMQNAADAAAMAGTIFLPSDYTTANSTAKSVAALNGFTDGSGGVSITTAQLSDPTQLQVTITYTDATFFTNLLGVGKVTLTRTAIATYQGAVPMGSPTNNLGNQPTWGTGATATAWTAGTGLTTQQQTLNTNPQFWTLVAGPNTDKQQGDRFAAGYCGSSMYNCANNVNSEAQVVATSPTTYGYWYDVQLTVAAGDLSKRLSIQAYDPAFIQQGNTCTNYNQLNGSGRGTESTFEANLHTLAGTSKPTWDATAANAVTYCPGDTDYRSSYPAIQTYFRVSQPDLTPWTPSDNTPVTGSNCAENRDWFTTRDWAGVGTFEGLKGAAPGTAPTTNNPPGLNGSLDYLLKGLNGASSVYFSNVFHNWVTVCNASMADLGITQAGTYKLPLRIRTDNLSEGQNRFALRGALVTDTANTSPDGSKVSIYAEGKLPIYMNVNGSQTQFYIARVLPGSANRTMVLSFWDIGDAAVTGTIQVVPPTDATTSSGALTAFSGCAASRTLNAMPSGDFNASTCTQTVNSGYNGQLVTVTFPIPATYNCNQASAFGCWITVKFNYGTGAVYDTTTWSANILGDPVRLIM